MLDAAKGDLFCGIAKFYIIDIGSTSSASSTSSSIGNSLRSFAISATAARTFCVKYQMCHL